MPNIDVTVDRQPLVDLRARVDSTPDKLFPTFTRRLEEHFDETFATQGRNIGHPWAPISQVTLKIDRDLARNTNPVEQASGIGIIRRSLTRQGPYSLRRSTADKVTVGTKHSMAAIQQRGHGRRRRGGRTQPTLPARTLAGVSPALAADLQQTTDRFIDGE